MKQSVKRKLIQFAAFGFSNSHVTNFAAGKLYKGPWKNFCNPGLNCYSCPAATFACPIGAMQTVSGSMKFRFSFYVVGMVLAMGVIFGRWICGFLCPFGLIQELIARIPVKKFRIPKALTWVKYGILVWFVLLMPVLFTNIVGMGQPAFCQYICPAGTLLGGIPMIALHPELRAALGSLFSLKAVILVGTLTGCLFCHRFFCKVMCPLGAIYGLLNKVSFLSVHVDRDKCVSCGRCAGVCKMQVDPVANCRSAECIRCGECAENCPQKAISIGFQNKTGVKANEKQ